VSGKRKLSKLTNQNLSEFVDYTVVVSKLGIRVFLLRPRQGSPLSFSVRLLAERSIDSSSSIFDH